LVPRPGRFEPGVAEEGYIQDIEAEVVIMHGDGSLSGYGRSVHVYA